MACDWQRLLQSAVATHRALDLYRGRSFALAASAANALGSEFVIISAGLGLVHAESVVPSYDITIRPHGPASVRERVVGEFSPANWWSHIKAGPFSADPKRVFAKKRLMLCLSRAYLTMIEDDLVTVARTQGDLRIFGLSLEKAAHRDLLPYIMPYDERLSNLGRRKGTRVDFPQRALTHYVESIAPRSLSLEDERVLVRELLDGVHPIAPKARRSRRTDDELKAIIADLVPSIGRSRSRLLTAMRAEKGIACEQGRFFRLCDQVFGGMR